MIQALLKPHGGVALRQASAPPHHAFEGLIMQKIHIRTSGVHLLLTSGKLPGSTYKALTDRSSTSLFNPCMSQLASEEGTC